MKNSTFSPIFLEKVDIMYVIVYTLIKVREIMNVTTFRKDIFNCLNKLEDGMPLRITNKNDSYIVMNEKDYSALQETIYLLQDPVTREMIMTPSDQIEWIDESEFPWNEKPTGN